MAITSSIKAVLISWYENLTMSDDERYLSQAVDHADLERRLKNLLNKHNTVRMIGA